MAFSEIFLVLFFLFTLRAENSDIIHPDFDLNITETIEKYGYPVETHEVTTEDGYILNIFRIPHGKGASGTNKKPIFVMHGLFGQAENYVIAGMYNASIAYHLADAGFDVWLGNTRGNQHGRRHINLNPKYRSFWNFSWHEIGMNDLPASIDYILKNIKMEKLYYIGHSQGGTTFYIMTSMKPEYQKKIILASLLAPAGYMTHFDNAFLLPLMNNMQRIENMAKLFYELPPQSMPVSAFLSSFCKEEIFREICLRIYNIIAGYDSKEIRKELLPVACKYIPSVSARQPLHYVQAAKSGHFRQWNYGKDQNMIAYGIPEPPDYPIKSIEVPIAIYYTLGDTLVNSKDIENICEDLPKCVRKYVVRNTKFTHIDFVYASDQKMLIYPLLEFLKKYNDETGNST